MFNVVYKILWRRQIRAYLQSIVTRRMCRVTSIEAADLIDLLV